MSLKGNAAGLEVIWQPVFAFQASPGRTQRAAYNRGPLSSGGADEDRTRDLLTASQALSQLSYSPTATYFIRLGLFSQAGFCGGPSKGPSQRGDLKPAERFLLYPAPVVLIFNFM